LSKDVILVDEADRPVGRMEKLEAHEAGALHRAFSVFLFDGQGRWLLQQRHPGKYHSGGLWTNTCCSHPAPGESTIEAAAVRLVDEMGITAVLEPAFAFSYRAELDHGLVEHEFDHVFVGRFDGEPTPNPIEASDWRWVDTDSLFRELDEHPERFTYWFREVAERVAHHVGNGQVILRPSTSDARPLIDFAHDHDVTVRTLRPDEASNENARTDLVVVVEPAGDPAADGLTNLFTQEREALGVAMREHGCVLFRGFDIDRDSFEETVSASFDSDRFVWMFPVPPRYARALLRLPVIGWINRTLLGWIESRATGRRLVGKKQSTLANDQTIQFPHHEYGIFFNVPRVIAFHCEADSEIEGETIICDARSGWDDLPQGVRDRFETARHIRYRDENQRWMPPLRAPAVLSHPIDGYPTLNFTAYHHDVAADIAREMYPDSTIRTDELDETFTFAPTFVDADGERSELGGDDVAAIARSHLAHSVLLRWERGDVLLMDNYRIVHGRLNAGTPRKVLQVILCDHVYNRPGLARLRR
jgi:isopentenyl-diphosphate delta-isomerase